MRASAWQVGLAGTLVAIASSTPASAQDLSPLQTVERLHKAMADADATIAAALLHADYHGASLQGGSDTRHVYVESKDKAVRDIAELHAGDWQVRFLRTNTQIDSHGMAHVWGRYVFYYKGAADHCGFESYGLIRDGGNWKIISFADTDNALKGRSVDQVCPDE
jgi:hypothetical protein